MNVIEPIRSHLEKNNIEVYPMGNNIYKPNHDNWNTSFIDDNTYILTMFRDPAKRTVSHFIENEKGAPDFNKKNNVKFFLEWVKENEYTRNFQSKSIIVDKPVNEADFNFEIKKEQLNEKLKRINLILKHKKMNYKYCLDIQEKITKDLKIDIYKNLGNFYNNKFSNKESQILYNQLNVKQIDYLYENSFKDSEIYFLNDNM
jgi:hypothetical protein